MGHNQEPSVVSELMGSARSSVDKPLPPISDIGSLVGFDVMSQLREASFSPSPLAELLQDPYLIKSLTKPRKASRRPSTSSLERVRREDRESDTTSVLTVVLAEEERQGNHLKALLRATGERLDAEIRRADQAETRVEFSDARTRELQIRLASTDTLRHQAELDASRSKEEVRRYQMQLEISERELQRVRANVTTLTRQKDDAEREATKARELARGYLQKIREYEAREDGREEGRRIGLRKGYSAGWEECWPIAHAEGHGRGFGAGQTEGFAEGRSEGYDIGFEEGRKKGKTEGISEGLEKGRKEERDRALVAFDKFLTEEMDGSVYDRDERTHRWVQSMQYTPDLTPKLRPAPSRGRLTTELEDRKADDKESKDSASLVIR